MKKKQKTLTKKDRSASLAVTSGSAGWEWYGHAAHFCCGRWCRFHLATKVGPWLVSTVGEYIHPRNSGASEKSEAEWLKDNHPGEDIGFGRKYETMVFKAGAACECGCGLPTIDGHEIDCRGANTATDARANHMALCAEYALKPNDEVSHGSAEKKL